MADYGVISDVSTSLVTLLDQDLRRSPLNARAGLDDLSGAARAGLTLTITLYERPLRTRRHGTARGRSDRTGRPW